MVKDKLINIEFFVDYDISEIPYYVSNVVSYANKEFLSNYYGEFSIYLAKSYLCFDVDLHMFRICSFNGVCDLSKFSPRKITKIKKSKDVIIRIKPNESYASGHGGRIEFNFKHFYDKETHIVLIGEPNDNLEWLRVFSNLYVQIDSKNHLNAIIIEDIKI